MTRTLFAAALAVCGFATPALAQHEGGAFLAAYDSNKDGTLTRAEYNAARAERFKATDANGDGSLSEDEYVAEFSGRFEKELAASGRSEEKKAEARQRQIRQTHVRFGVLDTDKDKKISLAEYQAIAERAFVEQDADKDGSITAQDVAATDARRKERRAQAE
jgi:hypothetical protein